MLAVDKRAPGKTEQRLGCTPSGIMHLQAAQLCFAHIPMPPAGTKRRVTCSPSTSGRPAKLSERWDTQLPAFVHLQAAQL